MILRGNVRSEVLGRDTGVTIIGPRDLKQGAPYKVTYVLHGLGNDQNSWADNSMLPFFAKKLKTLFILPDAGRSFYTNMQHGHNYFTYIADELPDIVSSVFRISARRDDTSIFGASMGGYGALMCALRYPYRYAYCGTISSALMNLSHALEKYNGDPDGFRDAHGEELFNDFRLILGDEFIYNPELELINHVELLDGQPLTPAIYHACGMDDYLYADNYTFAGWMENYNIDYTYEEWQGQHDWFFFNKALFKFLEFQKGREAKYKADLQSRLPEDRRQEDRRKTDRRT